MEKLYDIWLDPETFDIQQLKFLNNLIFYLHQGVWDFVEKNTFEADLTSLSENIYIDNYRGLIEFTIVFDAHPFQKFYCKIPKSAFSDYADIDTMMICVTSEIGKLYEEFLKQL